MSKIYPVILVLNWVMIYEMTNVYVHVACFGYDIPLLNTLLYLERAQ